MALSGESGGLAGALSGAWRRLRRRFAASRPGGRVRVGGPSPERLLLAPPDLSTPDPTIAEEIYAGIFHFGGKSVDTAAAGPFTASPPSAAWESELHSFVWLRHLSASKGPLSANNAQALVKDWISLNSRPDDSIAWEAQTASLRLIAWICHSPLIVENADLATYRQLLRSIGFHIRYLRAIFSALPDGMPRLLCLTALTYAEICVGWQKKPPKTSQKALDQEISRQILADGGHASRNPLIVCDLLALFLPLRQTLLRVGVAPSAELVSAIDRMMLALRFFRLGDGSIARFNGAGPTPHDLVATILRYDDVLGALPQTLPHSGYCRLAAGQTALVMDTGKSPSGDFSARAHAGTLAFELTDGQSPLIVNCAVAQDRQYSAAFAGRTTAAHSTMTLENTSVCRFETSPLPQGGNILVGPAHVTFSLLDGDAGAKLIASHDGYARNFGKVHERQLEVSRDGTFIAGTDRIPVVPSRAADRTQSDEFAVRFHLHPSVSVTQLEDAGSLHLRTRDGSQWVFTCRDCEPSLEESIFFAGPEGPRRTAQIVLRAQTSELAQCEWWLVRK